MLKKTIAITGQNCNTITVYCALPPKWNSKHLVALLVPQNTPTPSPQVASEAGPPFGATWHLRGRLAHPIGRHRLQRRLLGHWAVVGLGGGAIDCGRAGDDDLGAPEDWQRGAVL